MTDLKTLSPLSRCRSLAEYEQFCASAEAAECVVADSALLKANQTQETWSVPGFSICANEPVEFEVDQLSGGYFADGAWHPNLRERLVCPKTFLNNRQRLICTLVAQMAFKGSDVWFMEQVTPVYHWAVANLDNCQVIGSEYLGPDIISGTEVNGLRHEDGERASFADGSLDIVVSNEVFEHIPRPNLALAECCRVLRPGGRMIMTIPFSTGTHETVVRARMGSDQQIEHLLEPQYHGNPVSEEGSLVFTDFGWDVLETIVSIGFRDAWIDIYHAPEYGHYSSGLIVLEAVR